MVKTSGEGSSVFERLAPMLLIVSIGLAFLVGILWQKVTNIEKVGVTNPVNVAGNVANNGNAPVPDANGKLTEDQAKKLPPVTDADYIQGSRDADVLLVEYSDLECTFCARFHPTAQQAVDEYGNKIAWVYRHFPLETIHPRSLPGSIAAECVGSTAGNNGFWKFIETVFGDQTKYLTDAGLREAAVAAGADGNSFDTCYKAANFTDKIKDMMNKGAEAGVTGTPATYIVNKKGETWLVPGALPFESLKSTIDEALGS